MGSICAKSGVDEGKSKWVKLFASTASPKLAMSTIKGEENEANTCDANSKQSQAQTCGISDRRWRFKVDEIANQGWTTRSSEAPVKNSELAPEGKKV